MKTTYDELRTLCQDIREINSLDSAPCAIKMQMVMLATNLALAEHEHDWYDASDYDAALKKLMAEYAAPTMRELPANEERLPYTVTIWAEK